MIFMNMENSKTNKRHKCVRNLSPKLDSKRLSKHVALQSLSFNHTWENIRQQYKNNKLKMITPTQNNEWIVWRFLFSVRYSRLYRIHHKKHETLPANLPIHIYINRVNNRLKIKDEHKLELQTSETMKLFGSTKKLIDKTNNKENVPSLEVVEE